MTVEVFRNRYCLLKAMQFDGTPASAVALAKAFPGHVAGDLERPGTVLVLATRPIDAKVAQLRPLKPSEWLVAERICDGTPMALTNEHFRIVYQPHSET